MPILELVLCVMGVCLCLLKNSSYWMSIFPMAAGLIGLIGYAFGAAFHAGNNWVLHMLVCIVILALGVCLLLVGKKTEAEEEKT